MITFDDQTSSTVERMLDEFTEVKKKLEKSCRDLEAGIRLCKDSKFKKILLVPYEIYLRCEFKKKRTR